MNKNGTELSLFQGGPSVQISSDQAAEEEEDREDRIRREAEVCVLEFLLCPYRVVNLIFINFSLKRSCKEPLTICIQMTSTTIPSIQQTTLQRHILPSQMVTKEIFIQNKRIY